MVNGQRQRARGGLPSSFLGVRRCLPPVGSPRRLRLRGAVPVPAGAAGLPVPPAPWPARSRRTGCSLPPPAAVLGKKKKRKKEKERKRRKSASAGEGREGAGGGTRRLRLWGRVGPSRSPGRSWRCAGPRSAGRPHRMRPRRPVPHRPAPPGPALLCVAAPRSPRTRSGSGAKARPVPGCEERRGEKCTTARVCSYMQARTSRGGFSLSK